MILPLTLFNTSIYFGNLPASYAAWSEAPRPRTLVPCLMTGPISRRCCGSFVLRIKARAMRILAMQLSEGCPQDCAELVEGQRR